MTATETPLLRWSSVRSCPRKAVYEATGAPQRERTRKEDRQLARGRSVGHDYVVAIAADARRTVHVASGPDFMLPYPDLRATGEDSADILAEVKVRWEMGVGHADAYIRETDTVLEILSSQHASAEMIHSKLVQAVGYALALDADNVAVAVVDPATLDDERVIVTKKSKLWPELEREVNDRIAQVVEWRDTGEMPMRICRKPHDAIGHFCLHAAHCFENWKPPVVDKLVEMEAFNLAIRLAHVKGRRRELSSTDKLLAVEQKNIQADLEGHIIEPGERQIGNYLVTRSDRTKRTFKLALAEQDSRIPGELLDEFTNVSRFSVWDVAQTGPTVTLPDDEDGVPF